MKKIKKFDLHVHTKYSRCSTNSPKKILIQAKKKGLDGIAITDHNTIKGALEARELNKDKNFKVIIGEEVSTDLGHVLVYFLNKKNPTVIKPGSFERVIKDIKKQKALCVLAHPYNFLSDKIAKIFNLKYMRKSISRKDFSKLRFVDGIEVLNSRCLSRKENLEALKLAKKLKKPKSAGSDAHFLSDIGNAYVEFEGSLKNALKTDSLRIRGKIRKPLKSRLKSALSVILSFFRK